MNIGIRTVAALALAAMPAVAFAGHSNLQVPPSETFILGGEQRAAMMVSGKNVGSTTVEILARTGTRETAIARVAPGGSFERSYAVGETALIRNTSATATARLSVDFTGAPSELTMRYVAPPKK